MIATAGMTYTGKPSDEPARRAWSILSVLLGGHLLEMTFVQEHDGDPAGFWRVRYYDAVAGKERIKHYPVAGIDSVDDAKIREIRAITRKAEQARRQKEAAEKRVLGKLLAGAEIETGQYTADIVMEEHAGKKTPRLHVRKRRTGEKPPPVQ